MRKLTAIFSAVLLSVALAAPASAAGPCDSDGSGYGQNHIAAQAKAGGIGNGGHIPGTHQGFSVCLGVH